MPKGVYERTPEHRRKISDGIKGKQKGIPKSAEHRRKISEALTGRRREPHTPETKQRISLSMKGIPKSDEQRQHMTEARRKRPAAGFSFDDGYKRLHGVYDHPLSTSGGLVLEHRKILYDKIGPGPHECHWGCGRLLEWGDIQADHLNGARHDNRLENLVASCGTCNTNRSRAGNPTDWAAADVRNRN